MQMGYLINILFQWHIYRFFFHPDFHPDTSKDFFAKITAELYASG